MPLFTPEFIAGWIAGGTGVIIGHPLDTIKARLQTGNAYTGISDALRGIIAKESILLASCVGTAIQLVPAIPVELVKTRLQGGSIMGTRDMIGYCFYLPVYEGLKRIMHQWQFQEFTTTIFAGGIAGCTGWLSICPIEVVKNRVQVRSLFRFTPTSREREKERINKRMKERKELILLLQSNRRSDKFILKEEFDLSSEED
ncbi:hypothetical protein PRIPAC_74474 [Pristionchus pacificus]|uniref:Mitochondrial carrier protein n=1 Tax=Pristionchus pacificus TaxID=54126 RepID=A0A2A6C9J5_PRIPA|nr:hypothetical protein PRIPAC_74474 [Pristionchus pacificus]|eukprot:PDM74829.1 mitochondrial carrier protein [Pristionchus pacificus]